MRVIPSGKSLGAEVTGVNLSEDVSDTVVSLIIEAWRSHLVLIFRDQSLTDDILVSFSARLGELDPPAPNPYGRLIYPAYPELNVISNIVENGKPVGNLGSGEAVWHADMTYKEIPPKGAVLYAVELPAVGGDTYFANMQMAYSSLSATDKKCIDNRRAIHDASMNSAGMRRKDFDIISDVRETPGASHPLVRIDPRTGRKSLFLGRRPNSYVLGLPVSESEQLLDCLWAHATQSAFVFRHNWSMGDVLIWDNLSVLHRRDEFDGSDRRRLHRAQLKGDGPIR